MVSHNAAFVEADNKDPAIPTEASVARSLWEHYKAAQVINVGFAFPTLPNAALVDDDVDPIGPKSWVLDLVLQKMDARELHMIVAPAGNQDCMIPQYPAAFGQFHRERGRSWLDRPRRRKVGLLQLRSLGHVRHGRQGRDVDVHQRLDRLDPELDDDGSAPTKDFNSGWATWNGTSFAAPKVAGAIAELLSTGAAGTPLGAGRN